MKAGIGHAQRFEQAFAQECLQPVPGNPPDQQAQHIGAEAVIEMAARLIDQRQGAEPRQPFVGISSGEQQAIADMELGRLRRDRDGIGELADQPRPMGEEVQHRDRAR
jgi:hypothetical protein